jgi:hypothetical protein
MKKFLLLASLLTTSAMASPFSYTQLDLGYSWGSAELPGEFTALGLDDDLDVDGFFVAGRYEITNNFFVYANYENGDIETDDLLFGGEFEVDSWRAELGLGGYAGLADCLDVYYSVGYKYSELDLDELGIGDQNVGSIDLNVGLRWAPATWVEINPYVEYSIGVDDDEFVDSVNVLTAGLNVYVTAFEHVQPFVGVAAELDSSDDNVVSDLVLYSAGLRFSF